MIRNFALGLLVFVTFSAQATQTPSACALLLFDVQSLWESTGKKADLHRIERREKDDSDNHYYPSFLNGLRSVYPTSAPTKTPPPSTGWRVWLGLSNPSLETQTSPAPSPDPKSFLIGHNATIVLVNGQTVSGRVLNATTKLTERHSQGLQVLKSVELEHGEEIREEQIVDLNLEWTHTDVEEFETKMRLSYPNMATIDLKEFESSMTAQAQRNDHSIGNYSGFVSPSSPLIGKWIVAVIQVQDDSVKLVPNLRLITGQIEVQFHEHLSLYARDNKVWHHASFYLRQLNGQKIQFFPSSAIKAYSYPSAE